MPTLRIPPPRILWSASGDGLMAAYHRMLWGHWRLADRAMALALTGCAVALRPSRWNGRWNALSKADLDLAGRTDDLDDFIGMADRKGLHRLLNPGAFPLGANVLKNKHLFARRCADAQLPVPETFAGPATALPAWLDRMDAVMVKPNFASKGAGIVRHERGDGWPPTIAVAAANGAIVQQALTTHPALADLSPGALPTYRIMTILDERGMVEACDILLRLSRGGDRPVDNFNAGNLVARVGEDGRLGPAFGREDLPPGGSSSIARHGDHPVTGAVIEAVAPPLLAEARALAIAAHGRLGEGFTVIGWDIGVTAQGAMLIEGNWNPGTDVLQLVSGRGLGATRLGQLYRHHLDALAPDRWRAARPLSRDRR